MTVPSSSSTNYPSKNKDFLERCYNNIYLVQALWLYSDGNTIERQRKKCKEKRRKGKSEKIIERQKEALRGRQKNRPSSTLVEVDEG